MANIVKLNQLPEGSGTLSSDDIFVFMDDPSGSGITKKISLAQISAAIGGGDSQNPFDQDLNTTDFPTFSGVNLSNNSSLGQGSFDSGVGGNNGISLNCVVGYELNWQAGHLRNIVTGDNTGTPQVIYIDSDIQFPGSGMNYMAIDASGVTFPDGTSQNSANISSTNITDFSSSVSGLLPSVSGSGYAVTSFNNNVYTVSVTGVQPSGDYSVNGHSHVSSDVTDFSSSVSGLLPSVSGSGYAVTSFNNNIYTVSVTGVQPSGDYSTVGHTHISSDITDFNSSVSGLLPSKYPTVIQLGSVSGSINTNASIGDIFDLTLASSGTLANPSGSIDGQTVRWRITYAGSGIPLTLGNNFRIPSTATSPLPFSSTSGTMDILGATYDSDRDKWDIIAFVPGY